MRWLLYLSMLPLATACATVPAVRENGPVPVVRGTVDSFAPLVAPSAGAPSCETPMGPSLEAGERAVALVYDDDPGRQVTVTLGENGEPIRYMDVRGALSPEDLGRGDRTTIGLFLDGGYAVLSNRPDGGAPTVVEVPLSEALDSERLGTPSEAMERVLSMCAEEASPQS